MRLLLKLKFSYLGSVPNLGLVSHGGRPAYNSRLATKYLRGRRRAGDWVLQS
jgi:hypothetical protein